MTDERERVRPSGVCGHGGGVARVRQLETERGERAFATTGAVPSPRRRPVALSPPLPDDAGRATPPAGRVVLHRHQDEFLDDLLRGASASGVRQVVLLGAGMDSRAFG
ncbi:hypothetical protein GCM10017687_34550 [Streptomyces echinatus]